MTILRGICILPVLFSSLTVAGYVSSASAQDYWAMSCGDLWYRRNAIYAANGYCFKTARAIRVFGNPGCRFDYEGDVPLSRADREEISYIRSIERRKGC